MTGTEALDITRKALEVGLMVGLPMLVLTLFLGLVVSIFQALTQVQEMTLTFVPKLIGVGLLTILMGHWMLATLVKFLQLCLNRAAQVS